MTVARADIQRSQEGTLSGRIQVSWSTSAGCSRPTPEAQQAAWEIARRVEAGLRLREPLRLQVSACPAGCAGSHSGDIGLRVHPAHGRDPEPATVDLLFNGGTGLDRWVATMPVDELSARLVRLLRVYTVEGCGRDTFASWSRGLRDQELRTRLGLPEPAAFAAGRQAQPGGETLSTH